MIKKIMWAVSFLALAGTAVAVQFLPESVPMHYDFEGNIDRFGSRYESFIFPVVIILLSLFWSAFIAYFEKKAANAASEKDREAAKSNATVMSVVGLCMAIMFTVMHGFSEYGKFIYSANGGDKMTVDIGKVSVILMGLMFIVLGNYMTKTRMNSAIGFRMTWSMYNDNTWRKTNRFGAICLMLAGIMTIVFAALIKQSLVSVFIALGLLLAATVITAVYAHKVYKDEISLSSMNNP